MGRDILMPLIGSATAVDTGPVPRPDMETRILTAASAAPETTGAVYLDTQLVRAAVSDHTMLVSPAVSQAVPSPSSN